MPTAGVDLAAEPARTALAVVDWDTHWAVVTEVIREADDQTIVAALARAGKTGIDCTLGWPDAFIAFCRRSPVDLWGGAWSGPSPAK